MYQSIQVAIAVLLLSSLNLLLSAIAGAVEPLEPTGKRILTTYSNGVTAIAVEETTDKKGQFYNIYEIYNVYEAREEGKLRGRFNITSIRRDQTYTYLAGVFTDICTGQISIRRPNPESGLPIVAQVTWVIPNRGVHRQKQGCPVPNRHSFQINLPEALPKANDRGDFTNANSTTFLSESGIYVWTRWQVVAADGVLNCRDQPNGVVKHSYQTGQIINKLGREMLDGRNIVELPDGSSWLRTKEKCFVRASDRWIKPVSLPTRIW